MLTLSWLSLVITMATVNSAMATITTGFYRKLGTGRTVEGSIVWEGHTSRTKCAELCSSRTSCSSYQFNKHNKNCVLIDKSTGIYTFQSGLGSLIYQRDYCASVQCQNGGICINGNNSHICNCPPGYTGPYCEINIDECGSEPCNNNAACVDGVASYICSCVTGFTGLICETNIDDCPGTNPCQNGGACVDEINAYRCSCQTGYTGNQCESEADECESDPCQNNGTCADLFAGYSCTCQSGFNGDKCETNIDDCPGINPCQNGGFCIDKINTYTCLCQTGYTGPLCETNIDDCPGTNPCLNNGTCFDMINNYTCLCLTGTTGPICETNIDECGSEPCQNGGTCVDGINSYSCNCVGLFGGPECQGLIDPWTAPSGWTGGPPILYHGIEFPVGYTLIAGASTTAGKVGSLALSTTGTNQAVDFGLLFAGACIVKGNCGAAGGSMAVWIKSATTCPAASKGLMTSTNPVTTAGFMIDCYENIIRFVYRFNGYYGILEFPYPTVATWFHLVGVNDPSATRKVTAYLNSVESTNFAEGTVATTEGTGQFVVGRRTLDGSWYGYQKVEVDEIIFWNTALSGSEAQAVYNQYP